jgi:5-methylcytosine-specific restriction endonuclease McrA
MQNIPVLVLNQNYEPLNVCSARRAVLLVLSRKAEVLETASREMRSPSVSVGCPSVIRLHYMIRRPRGRVPLSRREVFVRDGYACQYCGKRTRNLTLDHVLPRSMGGRDTWDNLVSACAQCNHRKGNRTPEQARMRLVRPPREPSANPYRVVHRYLASTPPQEWLLYLPGG